MAASPAGSPGGGAVGGGAKDGEVVDGMPRRRRRPEWAAGHATTRN